MSLNVEEICDKLQNAERRQKINALKELQRQTENKDNKPEVILKMFDETYLFILKCYSDRFESVRDQAVNTVTTFIKCLPPNDFHLTNIVATLAERMGQQETLEESEEIRLLFTKQLNDLVTLYVEFSNMRSLQQCYPDIMKVLVKAIKDPYPVVQREACGVVINLAKSAETFYFQQFCETLAKALYTMLNHKHSQSRIIAVEALSRIALHIDASGEALTRLFMEVSPLLMDSMPLVRRECGKMGCLLAYELRDRYSYFERIVPLVLCCMKDSSPDVIDYIKPLWVRCGKQYYDENEVELNKAEIGDVPLENYPKDVERPTTGCRAIVQRSLRLLKLIMRESGDWKENVRFHSLRLLYQFVLHAEAAMTALFFEIFSDLAQCCRDTDPIIAKEAWKVADLMGRLFSYKDWIEHGFEGLERSTKEGYLKCFYYMFTVALGETFEDILRVSTLMIQRDFSQTLRPEIQMYCVKMNHTLLTKSSKYKIVQTDDMKEKLGELYKNLYLATIKVMAITFKSDQNNQEDLQKTCLELLENLAKEIDKSVSDLHEKYFAEALQHIDNLDAFNDENSEPILLLHGLICLCKFRPSYMFELQQKINIVWEHCTDDGKLKIFGAISIAMLNWHETFGKEVNESAEYLKNFVTICIEKHLEWRVGANAQAMRSLATATLCAISQGAEEEARLVLPTLHKYLPNLLEDNSISTRHYAVKCMYNFGEVDVEDMRLLAYGVLQRLDDPSASIRAMAVGALPCLKPKFKGVAEGESEDYGKEVWATFIKRAFDLLFLHYGGPEVNLNNAIKISLQDLVAKYPELADESYKKAVATTYNTSLSLKELGEALPIYVKQPQQLET